MGGCDCGIITRMNNSGLWCPGFRTAALSLAAAFVAGCSVPSEKPGDLRVGSYNVRLSSGDTGTPNSWSARRNDLAEMVRGLDLDVFGLQEVRPDQAAFFDAEFQGYARFGEHREADRVSGEASPIYYRADRFVSLEGGTFWLSETPDVPGRKGWGAACPRVCSWALLEDRRTGRRFCFANTHTDHVSALARKEGMLLIVRRMREFAPPGTPVVFTGDHNCRETSEPAKAVSALLKDALHASETPPKGSWRTYNGWKRISPEISASEALKLPADVRNSRGPGGCGPRIDYVYVSPDVRVLDYETVSRTRPGVENYPSDHFPVVATVRLPW